MRDEALAERVRQQQAEFGDPSVAARVMLAAQVLLHWLLVYPRTAALATRAFRWLTRRGLVVGSSGREEFDVARPADYALRPCRVQCRLGQREIRRIGENLARRWPAPPGAGWRSARGSEVELDAAPVRRREVEARRGATGMSGWLSPGRGRRR